MGDGGSTSGVAMIALAAWAVGLGAAGAVVALGGWFKNTVCVTRGDEAFVSQHVGDCAAQLRESLANLDALMAQAAHCMHARRRSIRIAAGLGGDGA